MFPSQHILRQPSVQSGCERCDAAIIQEAARHHVPFGSPLYSRYHNNMGDKNSTHARKKKCLSAKHQATARSDEDLEFPSSDTPIASDDGSPGTPRPKLTIKVAAKATAPPTAAAKSKSCTQEPPINLEQNCPGDNAGDDAHGKKLPKAPTMSLHV
jgi:hypothetical protein